MPGAAVHESGPVGLPATVASVETDQQYAAALRDLANRTHNRQRARDLAAHGRPSQPVADLAETDDTMTIATVAQDATLKSHEPIRARFDGPVTVAGGY